MPLVKMTQSGNPTFNKQKIDFDSFVKTKPKSTFSNVESLKQKAEKAADKSDGLFSSDDMKYQIAVQQAQNQLADVNNVNDQRMKDTIDDIYENELGAGEGAGRKYRGENSLTDLLNWGKNTINTINRGAGEAMDFLFDQSIGNLAGLISEDAKNSVQGLFDGEDAALAADMISDIGLSMIPYAGIPLVVAKNAIQQSDNFAEALSGVDNIAQTSLDGGQRFGKAGEALLATGLSAVPGIGKARKLATLAEPYKADKAVIKGIQGIDKSGIPKTAEESAKVFNADSKFENVLSRKDIIAANPENNMGPNGFVIKPWMQRAKEGIDEAKDYLKLDPNRDKLIAARDAAKEKRAQIKASEGKSSKEYEKANNDWLRIKQDLSDARMHPKLALDSFINAIAPSTSLTYNLRQAMPMKRILEAQGAAKAGKNSIERFGKDMAYLGENVGGALTAASLADMAETGSNPVQAIANTLARVQPFDEEGNTNMDGLVYTFLAPLGAGKLAKRQMAPSGSFSGHWNMPAIRAGSTMDALSDLAQKDIYEGVDEDTMEDRLLSYLKFGEKDENNG